ncbi:nuclear RNA export factor 2-like [Coccinella septempunctata]|uniref:nuclear RNA export factor 2-like n=1 Tax=Coccinella septempunctata TaxID=41139 RepID=UPI001D075BC8|nr:nuclear RNA export factor 2-like [Coccinella septempunctata]XP_044765762.1 nuclear RNA export factor 2-like [Coccinella septempunctata]
MSAREIIRNRNSGILLNKDTVRTRIISQQNIIMDPNIWHAFIIHTRKSMERNQLLQTIFDHIHPYELIPLRFESLDNGNSYIFIARDCASAIQKICANNLLIPNPLDKMFPMECEIILQYATVNELPRISIPDRLRAVLHSLYNSTSRTLNLDNFTKNEGLSDYLPLSQPKVLYYVLSAAANLNPLVIKLRNNDIYSLNNQEVLWKCTSLTHLDLRNNKIEDVSSFLCLKDMKVTEIDLDGNPLCDKMDEYTYITELKNIFPHLQKIDGEQVVRDGVPAFRKNFLCDVNGFMVVNKFIETYFFLYDKDRKSLEDLYHPNALCSLTNLYKIGQITSNDARLRPYQVNCRNLLALADVTRSHQYLIRGNQYIIRKLMDLPQVEHDPYSFTVDLVFHTDESAIINVSGVFREYPESVLGTERHLGFMRTFALRSYKGEYLIINDMLHVYNALSTQVSKAFMVAIPAINSKLPLAHTPKEKEKAIEAFKTLTGLTNDWSRRFLENAGYNIVECVKSFMDMYKVDKIPPIAFNQ